MGFFNNLKKNVCATLVSIVLCEISFHTVSCNKGTRPYNLPWRATVVDHYVRAKGNYLECHQTYPSTARRNALHITLRTEC